MLYKAYMGFMDAWGGGCPVRGSPASLLSVLLSCVLKVLLELPLYGLSDLCTTLSPMLFWVLSIEHLFSCVGNKPKDRSRDRRLQRQDHPHSTLSLPPFHPHVLPPAVHQCARATLGDGHIQGFHPKAELTQPPRAF